MPASFEPALGLGLEHEPEPVLAVIAAADSGVAVGAAAVAAAGLVAEPVVARPDWKVAAAAAAAAAVDFAVESALVVEGSVVNPARQEPAIELWMELVVLWLWIGSDLLDLQLAPLPSAEAAVKPAAVAAVILLRGRVRVIAVTEGLLLLARCVSWWIRRSRRLLLLLLLLLLRLRLLLLLLRLLLRLLLSLSLLVLYPLSLYMRSLNNLLLCLLRML